MPARCVLPGCLLALAVAGCSSFRGTAGDRAYEVSTAWIAGRPAVAWYGGRLAHEVIFLRFSDLRGRPDGPALQLTDATLDAFEPSLQALDGDALLAWYEQESAAEGRPPGQRALLGRFDAAGHRLWQRQLSPDNLRGRIPVVRVAGGVIHAAWLEQRADDPPVVRVASLDGAGNWLRAPRDAAQAGRDTWNLNAAIGPQGVLHVVFDVEADTGEKELRWLIVRGQGVEQHVSADDGRGSEFPDVALDGSRYAISWVDARDGNDEVYLSCGDLDEAGSPRIARDLAGGAARRVTRTTGESLGAYAAWHQGVLDLVWTEVKGARRELWRQQFDRQCEPRAPATRMKGWGEAGIPSLASSPAGLALAWNAVRGDPAAADSRVLLKVWPGRPVSPGAAAR